MKIETKFDITQKVVLKHDNERKPRMITRIFLSYNTTLYECSSGIEVSTHYEFELEKVSKRSQAGFIKKQ